MQDDFEFEDDEAYASAMSKASRFAGRTFVAALFVAGVFWGMLCIGNLIDEVHWGFPAWFWLATGGGYVASVLAVIVVNSKER